MAATASVRAELPAWLNAPPNQKRDFALQASDDASGTIEQIDLTRDEFVALKAHLANRRGIATASVQSSAPSSAPDGADGSFIGQPSSATLRTIHANAKRVFENMQLQVERFSRDDFSREVLRESAADFFLLAEVVSHWTNGSFEDRYPDELPLVSSIRGNLEL